jgi:hypothetical protein
MCGALDRTLFTVCRNALETHRFLVTRRAGQTKRFAIESNRRMLLSRQRAEGQKRGTKLPTTARSHE